MESLQTAILSADKETIPLTYYKTLPYPSNTEESKNKIEEVKEIYRIIERTGITPYHFRRLQTQKRELNHILNAQQTEQWNEIIQKTNIEKNPKISGKIYRN